MKASILVLLGIFWCILEGKFSIEVLILGIVICICLYGLDRLNSISK